MAAPEERAWNIVSVAQLMEWIAFTSAPQAREVNALTSVANGVTEAVESYLRRPVVARERTDHLDGTDGQDLNLLLYPTASLTSLSLLYTDGTVRLTWDPADYLLVPEVGRVHLWRQVFPLGVLNIKAVHSPGWTAGTVPDDISLAARFWANKLYKEWQGGAANDEIQSQNFDGQTTTFFVGPMPKKVEGMLKPHRLRVMA